VVAQLPADVHPGDVLLLQVTGFQGNQILVRNLGVQDPNNPVATFIPELPPSAAQGSSTAATLTTIAGNPVRSANAPPASVFVAASVRPAPATQQPQQAQQAQQAAPAPPVDIESRLAAARAATAERPIQALPAQPTAPAQTPAQQSRAINLPAAPPVITPSSAQPGASVAATAAQRAPLHWEPRSRSCRSGCIEGAGENSCRAARTGDSDDAGRGPGGDNCSHASANRIAEFGTGALPGELKRCAGRNATERNHLHAHLEPRNAPALSAQLSAFIGNVLGGAESKMSQLLQAFAARTQAVPGAPLSGEHLASSAPAHVPIVAQARAAERQMAISQDLKSTLLSLIANPPAGGSPQLTQAINESLIALTAMQFNTLIANQQDPGTVAMSVPLVFTMAAMLQTSACRAMRQTRSRSGWMRLIFTLHSSWIRMRSEP